MTSYRGICQHCHDEVDWYYHGEDGSLRDCVDVLNKKLSAALKKITEMEKADEDETRSLQTTNAEQ